MKTKRIWLLAASSLATGSIYCAIGNPQEDYKKFRGEWSTIIDRQNQIDHLRLLRLAHSKKPKTRRFGVRAIADLINLPDWQTMQISQLSDPSVVAALMLKGVPLEKLMKTFVSLNESGSLEQSVHKLLEILNLQSLDFCIKFYTELALHKPATVHTSDELDTLWSDTEEFADPKAMSERPDVKRLLGYTKALNAHSSIPSQCRRLVDERGLDVLLRLWRFAGSIDTVSQGAVRSLILKILCNIALNHDLKPYLVQTGWMPILKECSTSGQLIYNLLGQKVLYNISYDLEPDPKFQDGIYVLHDCQLNDVLPTIDLVFIHGLRGSLFWTWRQKDKAYLPEFESSEPRSMCWPKDWLPEDLNSNVRIIGVDYASFLSDWAPKCFDKSTKNWLEARSREFMEKLRNAGVGDRPIIWVTHSMGGLFLKQILRSLDNDKGLDKDLQVRCRPLLYNTAGCVFYAVPHYGSPVASRSVDTHYRHILWPSIEINELREDSPYLIKLHADFRRIVEIRGLEIINFAETLPTKFPMNFNLICVPERSAYGGFGRFYRLPEHHFNVCKPASRNSMSYQVLVQYINDVIDDIDFYSNI